MQLYTLCFLNHKHLLENKPSNLFLQTHCSLVSKTLIIIEPKRHRACLSSARHTERLCHQFGKWRQLLMTLSWTLKRDSLREQQRESMKEFSWETRHCVSPCRSMSLLNKHSSGSDVLWQRGAIVVVSSWQRDSSQNTAMSVRGGRTEGDW